MNSTQTIQALIDQAKKSPNGLLRNKLVSRLEDAKIVSELIDYQTGERFGVQPNITTGTSGLCTCPMPGVVHAHCPLHGINS